MKRPWVRLLTPLAAVLAVACARSDEHVSELHTQGLAIRASLDPEVSRVGDNRMRIELRDAAGRPVEGAALEVDVEMGSMGAMPAMGGAAHVVELGEGRYEAHFGLDMSGTWRVALRAQPKAGARAEAEGSLTVGTPGLRLEALSEAAPGEGTGVSEAATSAHAGPHASEVRISPERLQRIGVTTARAERRSLAPEIRAAGRVRYDETRLHDVSLKVRGWVEDLHVDAVGDRVERGEVLFTLYSPELYAAQNEYLVALRAQARARETAAPDRADYLVHAARNRLALWDIAAVDLDRLARTGNPLERLPIRSPVSGYVTEKNVVAGSAIEPGQLVYRIAPLDPIWVEADVYEEEIPLVRTGMPAAVEAPSLAGERFEGRVAWVYPELSPSTRTARVRIELANPDEKLRPDMFVNAYLRTAPREGLVVPLSAVLHAGDRSFVFLDLGGGRFRPQPVRVGLQVGEEIELLDGVEEGQAVVASATFLVAAESRLRAALDQW